MSLGTTIYTWFYGNLVGKDEFGNKYYCNIKDFEETKAKRWVIFKGSIEATKVPPHWHAWLHKSIEKPPLDYSHKYSWQKNHEQNMSGTNKAYFPDTHPLSSSYKNKKNENKYEYESWSP